MNAAVRDPQVSVLLPVWNAERYLAGAIDSVLAQTFVDFELLIVDDGSSDGSGALIRRYRDSRIRLIENEKNLGVARSLNVALHRARGRYVARADADDLCAPDRFERQVAFLDAHRDVALVASRARWIDTHGAEIGIVDTPLDDETLRRRLRRRNCIVHGSVMIRTQVLRALSGYDESMERAEDYDLWLRVIERHPIAALPDLLYSRRDHEGGIGSRHREQQQRVAERARRDARRRWSSHLVDEVAVGRISWRNAARRVLELVWEERWEEKKALPVVGRRARLVAACVRRVPRLHARCHALRNLGVLDRARLGLRACAAGREAPDATVATLLACFAELDRPRAGS